MKDLCVLKFGGTCLATEEDRKISAQHCRDILKEFSRAVVVVSAMGRRGDPYSTDSLLEQVSSPEESERASLMACGEVISAMVFSDLLRCSGLKAHAVTGWNAGLQTSDRDCNADLLSIERDYLVDALRTNQCVVVAGFQGMGSSGRISTLGRGGSDITATAVAAALEADELVLFKKVDAVYTADPEKVPGAMKLSRISAEDLRELAWQGAKVVHPRASEIASDEDVRISVRSHSTGEKVTSIEPFPLRTGRYITGVASGPEVSQFSVTGWQGSSMHEFYSTVFGAVANTEVSMDMFSVFDGKAVFTVPVYDAQRVAGTIAELGLEAETRGPCAKVSIVGAGMHGMKGVMARFARALNGAGIDMLQTVDSHATISALVELGERDDAMTAIHREFLEQ